MKRNKKKRPKRKKKEGDDLRTVHKNLDPPRKKEKTRLETDSGEDAMTSVE